MAGRAEDVVVKISTYKWNIQSGDVYVYEFYFLLNKSGASGTTKFKNLMVFGLCINFTYQINGIILYFTLFVYSS